MQVLFGHVRLRLSLTVPRLHLLYLSFSFLHQRAQEITESHSSGSHSMTADCKIKIIRYRLSFSLQGKLKAEESVLETGSSVHASCILIRTSSP